MKSLDEISSYKIEHTDAILPSDSIYSGVLVAGTEQTVTVPTGAEYVLFNFDKNIFVNYDTTATVPTGTISNASPAIP